MNHVARQYQGDPKELFRVQVRPTKKPGDLLPLLFEQVFQVLALQYH
jgi:hypothetical protein